MNATTTTKEPITLTENALAFIGRRIASDPKALALRLGIKKSGCSGFSYDLNYVQELPAEVQSVDSNEVSQSACDIVMKSKGIIVLIDSKSLPFLKNTVIDCIQDDFGEYLKFNNPNVKGECGCGESVNFEGTA